MGVFVAVSGRSLFCFFEDLLRRVKGAARERDIVLALVGLVYDLVEEVASFLLLQLVIWVNACVAGVVCCPAGRIDHVRCGEELPLRQVGGVCPNVWCIFNVEVK